MEEADEPDAPAREAEEDATKRVERQAMDEAQSRAKAQKEAQARTHSENSYQSSVAAADAETQEAREVDGEQAKRQARLGDVTLMETIECVLQMLKQDFSYIRWEQTQNMRRT